MPFSSRQQDKWAHTEEGEKDLGGPELDRSSKGKKLPKTAKHPIKEKHDMAEHISRVTEN